MRRLRRLWQKIKQYLFKKRSKEDDFDDGVADSGKIVQSITKSVSYPDRPAFKAPAYAFITGFLSAIFTGSCKSVS